MSLSRVKGAAIIEYPKLKSAAKHFDMNQITMPPDVTHS